ncbi:hypothetical protein Ae201684_009753 [Aphanomyces euteiches]|uniref:Cytochrome P450 n=1 Tax=Aphanomyces euteiches TaxID=100861 RepID=A0A6G0X152_9STRA|nr:hypothetical protein Ae201684_009753 [Aphanomyces euteiches]
MDGYVQIHALTTVQTATLMAHVASLLPQVSAKDLTVVAVAASSILLGTLILQYIWKSNQLNHIKGPPASSFLLGHALDIWGGIAKWKTHGLYPEPFLTWVKQYGGAVRFRLFSKHGVIFTDPVAIQHILVSNGANYQRQHIRRAYFADLLLGDGLLSAEGKQHDVFRKYLNPLFTASKIKSVVEIFNAQTQKYCQTILDPASDKQSPVNLSQMFTKLTLSVVGLAVLGIDFDSAPEVFEAYEQCMVEMSPLYLLGFFTVPGFASFPLPTLVKRRNAQATLKTIMTQVIHNKLASLETEQPKGLLDRILPFATMEDAISHTLTFVLAGHDTSSNTLGFVVGMLAANPPAISRIRAEYTKAIEKFGSLSSWDAVAELTYTQAVIHEALRLNAVAYAIIQRTANSNDAVPMSDGTTLFIPKGTAIQVNMAAMGRNPKYWTSPERFLPDRFIEGTAEWKADLALRGGKSHAFSFIPFSAGSKNCIGQRFAMAEIQLIVATLMSKYDFTPTANMSTRHEFGGITVKPLNIEMTVRRTTVPSA